MAIPGICPSCGVKFDLVQALTDADARQALAAALEIPAPLARLVVPYISLHAPAGRAVAMRKLARLLSDFKTLLTSGQVTRNGITHAAPLEIWREAIEQTLTARDTGTLILPLKDHAYVTEITWRLATKGAARKPAQTNRISHPSHRPANTTEKQSPKLTKTHLKNELENLIRLNDASPSAVMAAQIAANRKQMEEATHAD